MCVCICEFWYRYLSFSFLYCTSNEHLLLTNKILCVSFSQGLSFLNFTNFHKINKLNGSFSSSFGCRPKCYPLYPCVCMYVCLDPLAAFYKCLFLFVFIDLRFFFLFCLYFRLTSLLISEHIQEQNKSGAQPAQPMQHSQSCRSGSKKKKVTEQVENKRLVKNML